MPIQKWSNDITVAELADEPQFGEDITSLLDAVEPSPTNAVLNFHAVSFISSSDVARLLKLRKMLLAKGRRMILCGVNTQVWGIFLITGLDKVFEFTNDVSTALATLQLSAGKSENKPG